MPFISADAESHTKKADTPAKQKQWAETANNARLNAISKGASERQADVTGIKVANAIFESGLESGRDDAKNSGMISLFEETVSKPESVSLEEGIIRRVKILGKISDKGYSYSNKAMKDALPLYEGARVVFNHPEPGKVRKNIKYEDNFGHVHNCLLVEDDGIYGDMKFNPKHRLASQFAWDAENMPNNVGLSHEAWTDEKPKRGGIVEAIRKVDVIAIVPNPGTTVGLFESEGFEDDEEIDNQSNQGGLEVDFKELTIEDLKKNRRDLIESAVSSSEKDSARVEEMSKLKEENAQLLKDKDEAELKEQLANKQATIAKHLQESGLPESALTDVFKGQLSEAKDEDAVKALIADRKTLVETAAPGSPKSSWTNTQEQAESGGGEEGKAPTYEEAVQKVAGQSLKKAE